MAIWQDLLGEYDAESTTFSAFAGGAGSSPYTPKANARLRAIKVDVIRGAATQLVNHVQIRLTCATFKPINEINVGGDGSGLQTAPAFQNPMTVHEVDQEVKAGVPITLEGRNVTADTPVAVQVLVYAVFEG